MVHKNTKLVEWTIPEYEQREKSPDWYWGIGIIGVAGVVLSAVFGNFLLAVLIFISGLLLIVFSTKHPEMVAVEISEQGIAVQNKLFPYHNVKSFWILDRGEGISKIVLNIDRMVNPILSLPVHPEIPLEDLRNVMLEFVIEEEMDEPVGDKISDALGF